MTHEFDDDEVPGVPPPPEDRLWRHPSELRFLAGAGAPAGASTGSSRAPAAPPAVVPVRPRRSWGLAAAAFLAGAGLVGGLWFTLGSTSVRSVYLTERVPMQPLDSTPPRLVSPENWAEEVARDAWPSLARVEVDGATAVTGLVLRDDGLVITAAGPLGNQRALQVALPTGETVRATVLGSDPVTDIAVLHVDAEALVPAVVSRDRIMQVADTVAVVGTAGADAFVERSAVTGTSAVAASSDGHLHPDLIAVGLDTAAPGSAVLDESGSVVAVLTSVADDGNGYAVPIDTAREIAVTIAARDDIVHDGWIGLEPRDLDLLTPDGSPVNTVQIDDVVPGGPADLGGLHADDIIGTIADRPVRDVATFNTLVRSLEPGEVVTVEVLRSTLEGERQLVTLQVELGARPAG